MRPHADSATIPGQHRKFARPPTLHIPQACFSESQIFNLKSLIPQLLFMSSFLNLVTPGFRALSPDPMISGHKQVPEIVTATETIAIFLLGILFCLSLPAQAADTFSPTGSLATQRRNHTATLLSNGKVLVFGGFKSGLPPPGIIILASAELYDPVAGNWTAAGSFGTTRYDHTATLLSNGKVLVCGGVYYNGGYPASAGLYDPATGAWTETGSLAAGRGNPTATLLSNGKVLVCGGYNNGSYLASAEIYNPATGNWTAAGSLVTGRYSHTATLLSNGNVLITGGKGGRI